MKIFFAKMLKTHFLSKLKGYFSFMEVLSKIMKICAQFNSKFYYAEGKTSKWSNTVYGNSFYHCETISV